MSACGDREAASWGCYTSGSPNLSPPFFEGRSMFSHLTPMLSIVKDAHVPPWLIVPTASGTPMNASVSLLDVQIVYGTFRLGSASQPPPARPATTSRSSPARPSLARLPDRLLHAHDRLDIPPRCPDYLWHVPPLLIILPPAQSHSVIFQILPMIT